MLKRKNILILMGLLLVLVLALAACGGQQAATATEAPTQAVAQPTQAAAQPTQAAAQPTKAVAQQAAGYTCDDPLGCVEVAKGDPIELASALVVSGPNASLGLDSQYGVEIALKFRGEVLGHPLELEAEDGGCSAEGGQTAATKIVSNEKVAAVVGHNCSSSCTPAAPIYNDAGYTMVSPSCTAPSLTGADTHVASFLRTAHNDSIQGKVAAEFAYNVLGARSAATIHDGSPYAEQLQAVFADRFKELGGTITAQEAVNVGDTDMRPLLTSIATGNPDVLYYPIFIAEGGFVTAQSAEVSGLENTILMGADGMQSPEFIDAAGPAGEGMYLTGPDLSFGNELYQKFLAEYKKDYGTDPTAPFHAHAFDATNMILDAIEKVAVEDSDGTLYIPRQALRDALYATKDMSGITGTLSCDANGDCANPKIGVVQIQNGKFVPVWPKKEAAATEETATGKLGVVKVGTNAEYPPFESVDDAGNIVGFDVELMDAIAKAGGFDVEYVNTRWDGIFVALASGEFDAVVSAATITDERKQTVDFSDPYFNAGQMIAVKEGSDIKTPDDLNGKKVGVQLGTTGDIWLSENTTADVVRYDEITLAFQALAQGDVDAVVNDGPTSADIIRANPEMGVTLVGDPFTEELYGIAVNKDRQDVLAAINKGLAAVKASGEYDTIYNKWFGVK